MIELGRYEAGMLRAFHTGDVEGEYVPRPKQSFAEREARLQRQVEEGAKAVREHMANEGKKLANMARLRELRTQEK